MSSNTPKRWIVLLNKVPRGPLVEAEIRALLTEGLVRHNDIAFLVPDKDADPTEKQSSEWKLLWQFPEFDRRLEEEKNRTSDPKAASWAGTGTPQTPAPPVHPDRRHQMTEDEAEEKARETLPPELLDIAPEELVVHSTSQETFSMGDPVESPEQRSFDLHMPSQRVMATLGGIVLLVAAIVTLRSGNSGKSVKSAPSGGENNSFAVETKSGPARRAPAARVAPRPSGTIISPVAAPEARIPASGRRLEEPESAPDQGEFDPTDEDDQVAADDGEEGSRPAIKRRRPAKATRRSRVLSDDRPDSEEADDRGSSRPNEDDRDRPSDND